MLSIKMKSLSFSTGTGTYISLQIPAHLLPRAFFIIKALVHQNGQYVSQLMRSGSIDIMYNQQIQPVSSFSK